MNTNNNNFSKILGRLSVTIFSLVISNSVLAVDTDLDTLPDAWETANGRAPLQADYIIAAGGDTTCALSYTGVECWGDNRYGQKNVPALITPTKLSVGTRNVCALDIVGISCWGDNISLQNAVPTLTNPSDVSVGEQYVCALDDTDGVHKVECWGGARHGIIADLPVDLDFPLP